MLNKFKQSRIFVTFFSVITVGALLTGCAASEELETLPEETADTEQPIDQKEPEKEQPKTDGWEDQTLEDRCRMAIEQFPEIDPNAKVDPENYTLSEVMDPDLLPDCIYESDAGTTLPTQVSFYFGADLELYADLVKRLALLDFQAFNESPTMAQLQSTTTPGYIRVENWEADILLEPYVNKYDLKGKTIVVVTANYSPDFEEFNEEEFNFSDLSDTFNPDDRTTDEDD